MPISITDTTQDSQFQTDTIALLQNQLTENQNLLTFLQTQDTDDNTFQADSLTQLQAQSASLSTIESQTALNTNVSNQVDFLVAQTSLRKAQFQIQYLDTAGVYSIPESISANVLIVAGNAQINAIDGNVLATPIPMPTGFGLDLPFKSHYYFYAAMDIELLGNNSKMYITYEEPYTDFYPTNSPY
ncbi:MAG: hypothetical protein QNJ54_16190 [Prochloraceae cyanobacterium]|nr:hypothetical protein [Prochloraceae cyanobacterium]